MIINIEEARKILGDEAGHLSDREITRLIGFLEKLCNKFIGEVIK